MLAQPEPSRAAMLRCRSGRPFVGHRAAKLRATSHTATVYVGYTDEVQREETFQREENKWRRKRSIQLADDEL